MYNYPYFRPSLFSRGLGFAKNINWSGLLDGTQKTLGVINQAIPIVYQVKPIISNAKTMFKIVDSLKSSDSKKTESDIEKTQVKKQTPNENKPIFYI